MTVGATRSRQPKPLAAGAFQGIISSFRLHLAAEGKTVRMYTEAVQWFAAAHLLRETGRTGWDDIDDPLYWWMWLPRRSQPVPCCGRRAGVLVCRR
jgi:hypothetical protein